MYRTIDLFAGIGGIRQGYEMTGKFKNVLSAEIDKYACYQNEALDMRLSNFFDYVQEEESAA